MLITDCCGRNDNVEGVVGGLDSERGITAFLRTSRGMPPGEHLRKMDLEVESFL